VNQNLKKWIIKEHEKELSDKTLEDFLRTLKFNPDRVLEYFKSRLHNWAMFGACELREIVYSNYDSDPPELLEAFKEHFAEKLAALPDPPATPA
jgi:hypothetical protein